MAEVTPITETTENFSVNTRFELFTYVVGTFIVASAITFVWTFPPYRVAALLCVGVGLIFMKDFKNSVKWIYADGLVNAIKSAQINTESIRAVLHIFVTPFLFLTSGIYAGIVPGKYQLAAPIGFAVMSLLILHPFLKSLFSSSEDEE